MKQKYHFTQSITSLKHNISSNTPRHSTHHFTQHITSLNTSLHPTHHFTQNTTSPNT